MVPEKRKGSLFDFVIAQAVFVLIDDKEKVLEEIFRVLKPDGLFGSLELCWFREPEEGEYTEILAKTCSSLVPGMELFEDWEEAVASMGFIHGLTIKNPMPSGAVKLLQAEGFLNFLKVMIKMMTNRRMRRKMMSVQKTFVEFSDIFGYGIFAFVK